jgi:hypothetical protein
MRGLGQRETSKSCYVGFSKGVFIKRVEQPTADTITRALTMGPNAGNEVHELHFQTITGQLVDIKKDIHETYGASWEFIIDTTVEGQDPEQIILKMGYDNGHAKSFIKKLPNIDTNKDLLLKAFDNFTPQGTDKVLNGFSIRHDGEKETIKPAYTRDEPNGLPEMKVVKVKGKDVYDDHEQMIFLENIINTVIKPKLKNFEEPTTDEEPATDEDGGEVLPF